MLVDGETCAVGASKWQSGGERGFEIFPWRTLLLVFVHIWMNLRQPKNGNDVFVLLACFCCRALRSLPVDVPAAVCLRRSGNICLFFNCSTHGIADVFIAASLLLPPWFFLKSEFRELLDRLFSWCDLCLPGNEQAFAESHRQKIQKFQVQIVQEMKRSNSARSQVCLVPLCDCGAGRAREEIQLL